MNRTLIMNSQRIKNCTLRIAFQIFELNVESDSIIIAGIEANGMEYAKRIAECLTKISKIEVRLISIILNKKNPLSKISLSNSKIDLNNQNVILVDDVLNTGKTLIYAVKFLLNFKLNTLKTAVLVNRNHKNYPVKADFKGISLSTSINEHIKVEFNNKKEGVYLT